MYYLGLILVLFVSTVSLEPNNPATYPPAWVDRCGDEDGQISLFSEKAREFETCYKEHVDLQSLIEGFMEASQNNKVASYAKLQCKKTVPVKSCLDSYAASIEHCFNEDEKADVTATVGVLKSILDFVCDRDGEKILWFLRDKGMECFEQKNSQLHACINGTDKEDFNNITMPDDVSFIARISYNPMTCNKLTEIYQCMFDILKECSDRTPSLLFRSLSKWILKETSCTVVSSGILPNLSFTIFSIFILSFLIFK